MTAGAARSAGRQAVESGVDRRLAPQDRAVGVRRGHAQWGARPRRGILSHRGHGRRRAAPGSARAPGGRQARDRRQTWYARFVGDALAVMTAVVPPARIRRPLPRCGCPPARSPPFVHAANAQLGRAQRSWAPSTGRCWHTRRKHSPAVSCSFSIRGQP